MDIRVGDVLKMKKPHPCGSDRWLVTRVCADFKMRCLGCGRDIMNTRAKVEKYVRKIEREGTDGASL